MNILKRFYYKWFLRPESHLDFCGTCASWNPWHHPYTIHCCWCPKYQDESVEARKRNDDFNSRGGYYNGVGWPKDNIFDELTQFYAKKKGS